MNNEFKWTDELVEEYGNWFKRQSDVFVCHPQVALEQFKESKTKKQPIFVTEDGKPLYDGDEVWDVGLDEWQLIKTKCRKVVNVGWFNSHKMFSTEQAAKSYILENKPCLSIKEIDLCTHGHILDDAKLLTLTKQKLNL